MYFDTHAHLNFKAFRDDYRGVIESSLKQQTYLTIVGSHFKNSSLAVEIANEYDKGVWAAIGLHPTHLEKREISEESEKFISQGEGFDFKKYLELANNPKVKAIGETGLDFYRTEDPLFREKQREVFLQHIELSQQTGLPLIIHCRQAYPEIISILKEHSGIMGVIHCFTGNYQEAMEFLNLGFYLSFNGLITFAAEWDEILKKLPLDKILAETDCPLLTPVPFRGRRNEPVNVKLVVKKIAELKIADEEIAKSQIFNNSLAFFKIEKLF